MTRDFKKGGGMGVQNKKPSVGEYGYFLELHNEVLLLNYCAIYNILCLLLLTFRF